MNYLYKVYLVAQGFFLVNRILVYLLLSLLYNFWNTFSLHLKQSRITSETCVRILSGLSILNSLPLDSRGTEKHHKQYCYCMVLKTGTVSAYEGKNIYSFPQLLDWTNAKI